MMEFLKTNLVLAIYIGQAALGLVFLLGAYWIVKRLNFLVAMLMRESMEQAQQSKVIASELAAEGEKKAQQLSAKVEKAAAEVKGALSQKTPSLIPPGTVINMDVKTMDVKELNVPPEKKEK